MSERLKNVLLEFGESRQPVTIEGEDDDVLATTIQSESHKFDPDIRLARGTDGDSPDAMKVLLL